MEMLYGYTVDVTGKSLKDISMRDGGSWRRGGLSIKTGVLRRERAPASKASHTI